MLNLAPIDQRDDLATKGYVDDAVSAVPAHSVSAILAAAGWYRAVVYNAYDSYSAQGTSGEIVDIKIVWTATNNCGHHIKLFLDYGKVAFLGEESHGTYNIVDKIRYAYNGSVGYIDIHFVGTSSGNIPVHFAFDVTTRSYAAPNWISGNLEPVADAPSGETVLKTYTFATDCTPEARVLLWNNWNTNDVPPQTINMDLTGYKFIEVLFDPFAALGVIQCQRCLVGPSPSIACTATLQYYFLRTDATGTASVTAVSRGIDVYSSGVVIGNGQMLYDNTKYNDWPGRCRPLQIWGIR